GLGHSPDPTSVMYETLARGVARREVTARDLNVGNEENLPSALLAAPEPESGPLPAAGGELPGAPPTAPAGVRLSAAPTGPVAGDPLAGPAGVLVGAWLGPLGAPAAERGGPLAWTVA